MSGRLGPLAGRAKLDHWQRLAGAMSGGPIDRLPVSLWRHFPVEDETAAGLAEANVRWQRRFQFDLVKFMPTGTFSVEDWGVRTDYVPSVFGTRRVLALGAEKIADWERLRPLDPGAGCLGVQVEGLARTVTALDGEAPVLLTAFSPLTTALKLAGRDGLHAVMREAPDVLEAALEVITETTIRFIEASVQGGAHGLFLATQCADAAIMSRDDYTRFGIPFDLKVLGSAAAQLPFRMLHIHGEAAYFDMLASYPVNMLNWHDRMASPPLAVGRSLFPGLVAGGLNEEGPVSGSDVAASRRHLREALGGRLAPRTMIAPGCSLTMTTTDEMIDALIDEIACHGMAQEGSREEVADEQ